MAMAGASARLHRRGRPPAIVLGLNPNGLGIVRSLVSAGVHVVAVDHAPTSWVETHTWMSARTRLCERVFLPQGAGDDALVQVLEDIGKAAGRPCPVLPSGDDFVYTLSENRERLGHACRFHVPEPDVLDLLMQKGRFQDFCRREGIDSPATVAGSPEQLLAGARDLRFPVVVKPTHRGDAWDAHFEPNKAFAAASIDELAEVLDKVRVTHEPVLVQEVIPGPDTELYFSHGYFGPGGRTAALWTGRKLRQYPPGYGTSTLAETLDVPEVARITERVVRALGLRGYVSIEFKRDPRDATFRILEVTPARTWYPHLLGASVGFNLPHLWYQDLIGERLPDTPPLTPPDHVAWVDEYRDLIAAAQAWRRGELSMREWMDSYLSVRSFALLNPRDPLPGLFIMLRLAISVRNRIRAGSLPSTPPPGPPPAR